MMARSQRSKWRIRGWITYGVLAVAVAIAFWLSREVGGYGDADPAPLVRIPKGSSMSAATDSLAKAEVITSRNLFRVYAKTTGRSRAIKPGTYKFAKHTSYSGILDALVSGTGIMRTVTVPGRLMNELRGQTRPALWATGTMGAPLAAASHAPPRW